MGDRFFTYLADTAEAQNIHHHLRYKIFCERKHYEAGALVEQIPQERDSYDAGATRFIVKDHILDTWIGAARLVSNESHPLPAQRLGAFNERHERLLETNRAAEVSRLAMLPLYRSPKCTTELLRTVILGGMSHGRQHGIEWLVFLVSPGLARLLERLGVPMEACGPEVEHRGTRRAYRAHI
jgi:N-acyl-L-homoserine lactone synthetase